MRLRILLAIEFIVLSLLTCGAYNIRQTTDVDGLPNSAILSLKADDQGFLWIGTCDGVSVANGMDIVPFTTMFPGLHLSGNFIEKIIHCDNGVTWIQTNHGLDRILRHRGTMTSFPEFRGNEHLSMLDNGDVIVLTPAGLMCYVEGRSEGFTAMGPIKQNFNRVKAITVIDGKLFVIGNEGICEYTLTFDRDKNVYRISSPRMTSGQNVTFARVNDDVWAVVDNHLLGKMSPHGDFSVLMDIGGYTSSLGEISDIISDSKGNIVVSFLTGGAIRFSKDASGNAISDKLGLKAGVFCLERSKTQDVVWIGSDCQGIYTLSESGNMLRSVTFMALDQMISHPVRSIYLDDERTLWLGTKGSGLLQIFDFDEESPLQSLGRRQLLTTANSPLRSNSVYGMARSSRPVLWIGTEDGLNYYSYADRSIHQVPEHPLLRFVHEIYEPNDSTLIMATLGLGIIKARITGPATAPVLTDLRQYVTNGGGVSSNYFFAIADVPGTGIVVGNRGQGVFKLGADSLIKMPFANDWGTNSVYDVFSVVAADDALWLGTGTGLIRLGGGAEQLYSGPENGFINNTVHEILRDHNGNLWVAANGCLIRFQPSSGKSRSYTRQSGLAVSEFSDGAAFATSKSLLFGGIDGFVVVSQDGQEDSEASFMPPIMLQTMNIGGVNVNLYDYISTDKGETRLNLGADQNHFALTFAAPDFIDASNYSFSYTIDNGAWIEAGENRTISFSELNYGNYILKVRYLNRTTGAMSEPYELHITIHAPWYLSMPAKLVYLLLVIAAICFVIYYFLHRQRQHQRHEMALLEHTHKEEVYEEKLRFFTNITHEFCTPLTLIYGPCERILSYGGSDNYIKKYVGLIRSNTERLNTLIQELIDFRRMETGHKTLKIRPTDISRLCTDTLEAFAELAETNHINLQTEIEPDVTWNSDFSGLRKILYNLISNAFKYTPVGGIIRVRLKSGEKLEISVYNTGKGIREEDKERIFNRYSVLANVEENAVKGLSSRNGLGMAICHSIVEMLKGEIRIESVVGEYAEFIVELPQLEVTVQSEPAADKPDAPVAVKEDRSVEPDMSHPASKDKPTVLVFDDNAEILTLLSDSLTDYNILTAASAEEGMKLLTTRQPDLIITDVMMPGTDGFELTRQIKNNIHTRYIPLIILSAKNSMEERVGGLESGADVYVGKPFNLSYLNAVIHRLLESRESLKEYYNSSASAFEYNDGRLLERKDKDFLEKTVRYIDEHIDDENLSPEALAEYLQVSVRNLYRKFKELDLAAPNDFIKGQRMNMASKLLLTTSDTVQEIMYRTGFSNRSHFYKEFGRRFGMTPGEYRSNNRQH